MTFNNNTSEQFGEDGPQHTVVLKQEDEDA